MNNKIEENNKNDNNLVFVMKENEHGKYIVLKRKKRETASSNG